MTRGKRKSTERVACAYDVCRARTLTHIDVTCFDDGNVQEILSLTRKVAELDAALLNTVLSLFLCCAAVTRRVALHVALAIDSAHSESEQ